ncbi:type I-E CRISPR-associated protein Cse2/CasB [Streptomyces monomycini]|uniref:type I-E CRISPR-associated protein Cse2/CasB n=1 Tax=Streptomyces monomycini TaxID=371720 RepID=UPI001EECCF73|nr:type I-E CRISPR-associated protein Cse2/CasB [Streptomyces monomycini]
MSSTPSAPAARPSQQRASDRFIAYVQQLCASNRTRAELRRGLGLPVDRCNYLHRYLVPFLAPTHGKQVPREQRRAYYAVAALIAARPRAVRDTEPAGWHEGRPPENWFARANLGACLGRAAADGVLKARSAEGVLHLMCQQSAESIHPGLPALTRQLANGGVAVDWAVLLEDLARWDRDRDRIATRWLESYFRVLHAENPADLTVPNALNDSTEENES